MKHLIDTINFAYHGYLNAKTEDTYDEDSEADHADGVFMGKQEAYKQVIKQCCKDLMEEL